MAEAKQGGSGIIRVQHDTTRPYFVMSKALAEDERLSYAARGMMCYLLAKPDNWELRMSDLIKSSPGGLRHIRAVLHELEEFGYVRRSREKTTGGRFAWITVVYESPSAQNVSMVRPSAHNASVGNVPIQNASMQNVPIYQVPSGVSTKGPSNKGGGERTNGKTPPPPPDAIITGLIKAGLTPQQAERDAPQQEFTPALLAALLEWAKELRSRGVNPGKVLQGYTKIGMLPPDLPQPAQPPPRHVNFDENGQPDDPELLRQILAKSREATVASSRVGR